MNTTVAKGVWKELKGDLKQTWSKLTDDDIRYLHGNADEIIGKIQQAYGFSKDRAAREFENFKKSHSSYFRDERENDNDGIKEDAMGSINGSFENQDLADEISGPAKKYLQKAKDLAGEAASKSSDLVKTYPGYTVLGAVAIGFIAGAYLARRRD